LTQVKGQAVAVERDGLRALTMLESRSNLSKLDSYEDFS